MARRVGRSSGRGGGSVTWVDEPGDVVGTRIIDRASERNSEATRSVRGDRADTRTHVGSSAVSFAVVEGAVEEEETGGVCEEEEEEEGGGRECGSIKQKKATCVGRRRRRRRREGGVVRAVGPCSLLAVEEGCRGGGGGGPSVGRSVRRSIVPPRRVGRSGV